MRWCAVIIDILQIASMVLSVYAAAVWLWHLRAWTLAKAVTLALLVNALFYLAVYNDWLLPSNHNLYSTVRVLVLVICLAALPSVIKDRTLL